MTTTTPVRHVAVDTVTHRIVNPLLRFAVRCGWGMRGTRILTVAGRRSGRLRDSIVIPVEVDGVRHLVAPRGSTDWVRNLRTAGSGSLRLGRRREQVTAIELPDGEKAPVLRRYLADNGDLIADIVDVDADASDTDLITAGAGVPVFRLS